MTVSELSVRRPVLMTMVYLLIAVIAIVFLPRLDIALYPSVELPVVSVIVNCNDAGPEEVELQVAEVIEDAVGNIENLDTMTSISSEGSCFVVLQFNYGTDLDEARDDVQNAVSPISRFLPDWAESPTVMTFDASSSSSVLRLMLTGNMTVDELQTIADETVSPLIERIEGVSQVDSFGGSTVEYDILASSNRMQAHGVTLSQISAAIAARNIQSTTGEITQNGIDYQITIDGRYQSIEDIENTLVATVGGYPVRIRDVADVVETTEEGGRESYYNGDQVVTMSVSNDSDSNETTVAQAVIAALPSIQAELPDGVTISVQRDSTEMITQTMDAVYSSLVEGVILAALIIFVFLRGIKSTIIISLSMPICVLITLMIMSITGMSVNSMSMSGLILGIGMIVDASIIILENTYSFRQQGEKSAVAAILGSQNMFLAIVASTLTTLCVFVPFIIYKYELGMIGVMIQDLVITVCISLACSLFVSVTLVPALCGSILRINTRTQKPLKNRVLRRIDDAMASAEEKMRNGYAKVLDYFLSHRLLLIVLLVTLLAFSLQQFSGIGISLTPAMTTDDEVSLSLTLAPGTTQDVTREYVFDMQQRIIETVPEDAYESITLQVGSSNTGSITIGLPDIDQQAYSATEIQNMIRPLTTERPEANWLLSTGRGFSTPIEISIHSEDEDAALQVSNDIVNILTEHVPEVVDIDTDLEDGSPKIEVTVDYDLAREMGVSVSDLSTTLTAALTGLTSTQISTFSNDTSYDVVVKLDDADVSQVNNLASVTVPSTTRGNVRLETFTTFTEGTSPRRIMREDKVRVNHVTANLAEGYSTSDVQALVVDALDEYLVLPEGVTIEQTGEMSDFSEYGPSLIMIVLLALFLVYAVMAAQFESLIDPLIIFATIPLLLIGVVWVHIIYGADFTLFSIVGIVALIGVVVNNGIVLIDCINRLVRQKVPVREACLQAARGRLRPILMTTLTTILGLIPMAFFPGEGSELMQPIALTFVGGILTGAFLTLLLSPVLYSLLNTRREKKYDDPESLTNQLLEYDMRKLKHIDDQL